MPSSSEHAKRVGVSASKGERQKQSVMGTNNSSIVSKRSVERLYLDEPHLFRHFVGKPQRRSPLINRGYWLRMRAVDAVVEKFLHQSSQCQKVVINMGCGFDPLAFQWLSKSEVSSIDVVFVDVDYPQLIEQKSQVILKTPELREIVAPNTKLDDVKDVFYSSDRYYALGCDLSDTRKLESVLAAILDLSQALILCTAEVSMTYMPIDAADNLIKWAAGIGNVQFCLLEQYLPDGDDHPFASKMIAHFESLRTPLRNISRYPQLRDVEHRFRQSGWSQVTARSLWDIQCDRDFVTQEDSLRINQKEAFDEWEELVLFASHYFLLVAYTRPFSKQDESGNNDHHVESPGNGPNLLISTATASDTKTGPQRRFGAIIPYIDGFGHHGGLDSRTRSSTVDKYIFQLSESIEGKGAGGGDLADKPDLSRIHAPRARMCHTITPISGHCLLVGGRTSPTEALRDCWTLSDGDWKETDPLPFPLFRHSAAHVQIVQSGQIQDAVLIHGGKLSATAVSNTWLLWQKGTGWMIIPAIGVQPAARFGACLTSTAPDKGVLLGGMAEDGIILQDHYEWSIFAGEQGFYVQCHKFRVANPNYGPARFTDRFGAVLNSSRLGLLLIGGVSHKVIPKNYEVLKLTIEEMEDGTKLCRAKPVPIDMALARPLLIGHNVLARDNDVFVVGGGAVCFSFGTFWNGTMIKISPDDGKHTAFIRKLTTPSTTSLRNPEAPLQPPGHSERTCSVDRRTVKNAAEFAAVVSEGRPVILEGLDLGACVSDWQSLDHVKARVGPDREVVVHECATMQMDFQHKNFSYIRKSFGVFLDEVSNGSMQYLRSLASDNPARKAANFEADFPRLASDFDLPDALGVVKNQAHSSVLRVSGPVNMWLHYDVMANVLCQIRSSKTVVLFPPSDVSHLSFPAGSSTSAVDCFRVDFSTHPRLARTHRHEARLEPGEVLFIPPLWLHATSPGAGVGISVNVFFRSLEGGYAPGRDVYANRDVQAYEQGRRDVERLCQSFDRLPADMRGFYLDRLGDELKERAWNVRSG